jgi:acyl-CoA thioesterase-1
MRCIFFVFLYCVTSPPVWAGERETIIVLGDSISAAYGLDQVDDGWVALLRNKLKTRNIDVINASISGDTSQGGLARLDPLLSGYHPKVILIELGGNDGLRGLTPMQMKHNLTEIIRRSRNAHAETLILGMKIPPNYGKRYADLFERVYKEIAAQEHVSLVPFLLEGIGGQDRYMQLDGLHPNKEAQPILMDLVLKALVPLLGKKNQS